MALTVAVLVGREPAHRYSVHRAYVDAVWAVDAVPVVLPPPPLDGSLDGLREVVATCDALLLTGGGDVSPSAYGEEPAVPLMDLDATRDRAELAALEVTMALGHPVLGICRGIQVLAVALGATLHQDLTLAGYQNHWEEERQFEPVHSVSADPGSLASRALGGAARVNSIHHQAVHETGPALRATAWSADGVIEAVETDGALGVQWHPERLVRDDQRHLAAFAWLRETA
ncbi:MAG: gamma-glutamyl-gamma-aminobutyrate hydrolase family protein [Actinomycetota bacterium]|nr:gamma-glutamyl-gamma-aminobutyrate hydrolase family protein [Actinomycetota bacterium]